MSVTRRSLVFATVLTMGACASDEAVEPGNAVESSSIATSTDAVDTGNVTVDDVSGPIDVAVTDQGVWALDEYAGLQLLALDVEPVAVEAFFEDAAAAAVLADAGIELVPPGNIEAMAAADPAVITGIGHPTFLDMRTILAEIAPTVFPDFSTPWEEQLAVFGDMTGRGSRVEALIGRVGDRERALADKIAGSELDGAVVSILAAFPDGTFYAFDNSSLAGTIAERVGLTRPPGQVNDDDTDFSFVQLSEEQLVDQGGDVIISLTGPSTAGQSILANPLLPTAGAVTADVDSSAWGVSNILSAWWILNDMEAVLLDRGAIATPADASTMFAELTDL